MDSHPLVAEFWAEHPEAVDLQATVEALAPPLPPWVLHDNQLVRRWVASARVAALVAHHHSADDPAEARAFALHAAYALMQNEQLIV